MNMGECDRFGYQVTGFDAKVLGSLGFKADDTVSWSDLLTTIAASIDQDQLWELCSDCRWRDLKYCSDGLAALSVAGDEITGSAGSAADG